MKQLRLPIQKCRDYLKLEKLGLDSLNLWIRVGRKLSYERMKPRAGQHIRIRHHSHQPNKTGLFCLNFYCFEPSVIRRPSEMA